MTVFPTRLRHQCPHSPWLSLVLAWLCFLASATASAQTVHAGTLFPDEGLGPNDVLESPDQRYRLVNQGDGVLVYEVEGYTLWSERPSTQVGVLYMQADGNLTYLVNGLPTWSTGTGSTPEVNNNGSWLQAQDDGNLVLYRPNPADPEHPGVVAVLSPPNLDPPSYWLGPDGWLAPGQELKSSNDRYRLRNQENGELRIVFDGWYTVWTSGAGAPGWATVERDTGNFVLHRADGSLWSLGINGHSGAHLTLTDSGDLILYDPPWLGGGVVWHADPTYTEPPPPSLSVSGQSEGGIVTLRSGEPLQVQAAALRGTSADEVRLYTTAGLEIARETNLDGVHDTTVTFSGSQVPTSGSVVARYYSDVYDEQAEQVVLATGPTVTIVPVSLEVNGQACCSTVWVHDTDQIAVRALNYSGNATDWIGLYRVGAPWTQPVAQRFLDGSTSAPPDTTIEDGQIVFDTLLEQGEFYDVRLFKANATAPMATFSQIYVQPVPPTLTLTGAAPQKDVAEGEALVAQVDHSPSATSSMVYAASLQPDGENCSLPLLPNWPIAAGMTTLPFSAPVAPGTYRLYVCRLVQDGENASWAMESGGAPIVVHAPVLTVNGAGELGTTSVRAMKPLTAAVAWAPDLNDRVVVTAAAGGSPYYETRGLQGDQRTATAVFTMPALTPGNSLQSSLLWSDGTQVRATGPTIAPLNYKIWLRTPTLTECLCDLNDVPPGTVVDAAIGAEGHVSGDWLGLFRVGAGDGTWEWQAFLPDLSNGTLAGSPAYRASFTMSSASSAQDYEIRFFDGDSWVRLGTSPLIHVRAGGPTAGTRRLTINGHGAGAPVVTSKLASLVAVVEGERFGDGDRIVFVQQTNQQRLAMTYSVFGPGAVPITVPNAGGDFIVWWISDQPPGAVQGPTLQVPGLPGVDMLTFYDTDAIGSVRQITGMDGAVLERHDYLPFGTEWPSQGALGEHKVTFAGKERDAESGLDYFGARYFSSNTGRFVSADPVTVTAARAVDPQRWNRYSYAKNAPLRFGDPTGLEVELTGTRDERDRLFKAIQEAVGPSAQGYLSVKRHWFSRTDTVTVSNSAAFAESNSVAKKLAGLIAEPARRVTIAFANEGTSYRTKDGSVTLGPSDSTYRYTPAVTLFDAYLPRVTTSITNGGLGYLAAEFMFTGGDSDNRLSVIVGHELGHVDARWYHNGPNDPSNNQQAVSFENEIRRLQSPQAPLRGIH